MTPKISNYGAEKTPKMVRKKSGSLFCFLIPFSHKKVFLIAALSSPIICLLMMFIYKNDSIATYLFTTGLLSVFSCLMFCYYNFSGMYITSNKTVYYQFIVFRFKINMQNVAAFFIVDAVIHLAKDGYYYFEDEKTGERMSKMILVRKIDKQMERGYYYSAQFEKRFPHLVMAKCMYDEDFLAELLKINPKIRVINKTMRELKTSSFGTNENNN